MSRVAGTPRPTLLTVALSLGAVISLASACAVYDPELLKGAGGDRGGRSGLGGNDGNEGGGSSSDGGTSGTGGGSSGGDAGAESGGGGSGGSGPTSGGGTAGRGGSGGSQGGSASGGKGAATSGGGGGTTSGGAPATGGSSGKGGAPTSGGAPPKGGTTGMAGNDGDAGDGGGGPVDECPNDPNKTEPGKCGCGVAETDSDNDGTPNCLDQCPNDAGKIVPGTCGCGIPEQDTANAAGCLPLRAALVHRYRFNGTGTQATDSVGTAHGTVINTTLNNSGSVTLGGGTTNQYVDLPNGIISSLSNATFEAWVNWSGGAIWQRIFDFGTTGSEAQGTGTAYFFLTPKDGLASGTLRAVFSTAGTASETVAGSASVLASGSVKHVTVVVNDTSDQLIVYVDGVSVASQAYTGHLSSISNVNNWLGRSQFSGDAEFGGSISEFRIFNAALTQAQVTLTQSTGSDPTFLP